MKRLFVWTMAVTFLGPMACFFGARVTLSEPTERQQYSCAQVRNFAVGKSRAELEAYAVQYRITDRQRRFAIACLHARRRFGKLE